MIKMDLFIYSILYKYFAIHSIPKDILRLIYEAFPEKIDIACGSFHFFVIKDKTYAFGDNKYDQLGI